MMSSRGQGNNTLFSTTVHRLSGLERSPVRQGEVGGRADIARDQGTHPVPAEYREGTEQHIEENAEEGDRSKRRFRRVRNT